MHRADFSAKADWSNSFSVQGATWTWTSFLLVPQDKTVEHHPPQPWLQTQRKSLWTVAFWAQLAELGWPSTHGSTTLMMMGWQVYGELGEELYQSSERAPWNKVPLMKTDKARHSTEGPNAASPRWLTYVQSLYKHTLWFTEFMHMLEGKYLI